MTDQPIKISDNLSLYSGDIITLNNSQPLLVEMIDNESIRLKDFKDNKYLYKSKNPFKSIDFSENFEKALNFAINQYENKISLQVKNQSKYLGANANKFSLTLKETWLIIDKNNKLESIENSFCYEEKNFSRKERFDLDNEKMLNDCKFHNFDFEFNKTEDSISLEIHDKLLLSVVESENNQAVEKNSMISKTESEASQEEIQEEDFLSKEEKKIESTNCFLVDFKRIIGKNIYEHLINDDNDFDEKNQDLIDDLARLEIKMNNEEKIFINKERENLRVKTRNILIIGKRGNGKSALGNLLLNKIGEGVDFEEFFKENKFSISKTRNIESKEVEIDGVNYRIIDTIGFSDFEGLDDKKVSDYLSKVSCEIKDGLTQILLVIGGRFTLAEAKIYNIIRKKFFDKSENVTDYTTIVRTKFPHFKDDVMCNKDLELIKKENEILAELVQSCNGFIHIDNPSLEFSRDEEEMNIDKETKKTSKSKLLKHLGECKNVLKSNVINLSENWQSDEKLTETLKEKRKEKERKKIFTKLIHKTNKVGKEFKDKISGGGNLKTEKETENSSLKAVIEINDICKQM